MANPIVNQISQTTISPSRTAGKGSENNALELSRQFGNVLDQAIDRLNQQQLTVHQLNERFIRGDLENAHDLLIASQKASLGLELTVQVRNKVVEAYQDIMRMQI